MERAAHFVSLIMTFCLFHLTTALALGVSLDPFNQKITLIDDQVDTADSPVKCKLQNSTRPPAFSMDGDYIIGGIFSIHSYIHTVDSNYTTMPEPVRCKGRSVRERSMLFLCEEKNTLTLCSRSISAYFLLIFHNCALKIISNVTFD